MNGAAGHAAFAGAAHSATAHSDAAHSATAHSDAAPSAARAPRPALETLLGAPQAAAFMAGAWPERHLAVHRDAGALPPVLRSAPLAGLDALARRYRGAVTFGRGARDARTASADVDPVHLFRLGLSVYLADIGPCVPGLQDWLLALARDLGLPPGCATIGAFASPRADGVAVHFDADDVFSIQLRGRKAFHVAKADGLPWPAGRQFGPGMLPGDELYPQAGAGFPSPDGLAFERIEMAPGSVLFLPRGTWHRSEALEDAFSVSIGIRAPAALDRLLAQLRDVLLQDPAWRRPLYEAHRPGRAGAELVAYADGLLAALPAALGALSGLRLVRPDLAPPRWQRVPMARLDYRVAGARLRLTVRALDEAWNERLTLDTVAPAHLAPALGWIAQHPAAFDEDALRVRFPDIPPADRAQLPDLLARAGFLRRLAYPALPGA